MRRDTDEAPTRDLNTQIQPIWLPWHPLGLPQDTKLTLHLALTHIPLRLPTIDAPRRHRLITTMHAPPPHLTARPSHLCRPTRRLWLHTRPVCPQFRLNRAARHSSQVGPLSQGVWRRRQPLLPVARNEVDWTCAICWTPVILKAAPAPIATCSMRWIAEARNSNSYVAIRYPSGN